MRHGLILSGIAKATPEGCIFASCGRLNFGELVRLCIITTNDRDHVSWRKPLAIVDS
jgi:hypothetical protein